MSETDSDFDGEFPNYKLTEEGEARIRADAEARGWNPDHFVGIVLRSANDPETHEDMRHMNWHIETNTPLDGTCPQGCLAEDAGAVLARLHEPPSSKTGGTPE